jgi:hypothetical protein
MLMAQTEFNACPKCGIGKMKADRRGPHQAEIQTRTERHVLRGTISEITVATQTTDRPES